MPFGRKGLAHFSASSGADGKVVHFLEFTDAPMHGVEGTGSGSFTTTLIGFGSCGIRLPRDDYRAREPASH